MWKEENNQLQKTFEFKDFKQAWNFMEKVALLAEEHNHHPRWINNYNVVEIYLTTHDEGNRVTQKDRMMAETIDGCINIKK